MHKPHAHITLKSSNKKTGKMPVSTQHSDTCPTSCPFKSRGCYADNFHLDLHWKKVDAKTIGTSWSDFCREVSDLKADIWRYAQAGDLPGRGDHIDLRALKMLVRANDGRKSICYTHKPTSRRHNRDAISYANEHGFTVNLSANNLAHADNLLALGIAPVVAVVPDKPADLPRRYKTPQGNAVLLCPAYYVDGLTCQACTICSMRERDYIVALPVHGNGADKARAVCNTYKG